MADDNQSEVERLQQELADSKEQTRPTTFEEMLGSYHDLTSKPIKIQKAAQSTQGSYTCPRGKYIPTKLLPWTDFLESQESRSDVLRGFFSRQRLFDPSIGIETVGRKFVNPLSSEQGVRVNSWLGVETIVQDIVAKLLEDDHMRTSLSLGKGLKFEDHTNALSDSGEEVQARAARSKLRDFIPADQYSIVVRTDGNADDSIETTRAEILFLIEYKAAHKLRASTLHDVLTNSDFDIKKLINNPKVPTDDNGKARFRSEMAVAAAISQLFEYLVRSGLEYGYLTSYESFVFLHIEENDPATAYYHIAVPNQDVGENGLSRTSISQVLCFSLLALTSRPRSQQWIQKATKDLEKWEIDDEEVQRQMSPDREIRKPKESDYTPSTGGKSDVTSTYGLRSKGSCNDPNLGSNDIGSGGSSDGSDDEAQPARPLTRLMAARGGTSAGTSGGKNAGASQPPASGNQSLPYCSHQCLLGLVHGASMDTQCPNYDMHPKKSGGNSAGMHSLDLESLQGLLRDQLAETMHINCTPMRKQGARGAMFKLTLASHGYTFVGKGTVKVFVPALRFEGRIYDRLRPAQGCIVPVCLGNIDCVYPYYYHFATEIVHFILLSWAGESLVSNPQIDWESQYHQIHQMNEQLRSLGVEQGDIRPENVLWNETLKQLMIIDFERSRMIPPMKAKPTPSRPLGAKTEVLKSSQPVGCKWRRYEVSSGPDIKRKRSLSAGDRPRPSIVV